MCSVCGLRLLYTYIYLGTLRLVVKNVSGLLPDQQRRDGERIVEAIVLSYQKVWMKHWRILL